MNLETFIPCSANLEACVTTNEESDNPCCNDVDDPKIISANSTYNFVFDWTATGVLFDIIEGMGGATWDLEVLLESVGDVADNNKQKPNGDPIPVVANIPQQATISFNAADLAGFGGRMLKPVAKLHLRVAGFMVACAFSELDMVHVSEDIA